jgi:hypothetical protein
MANIYVSKTATNGYAVGDDSRNRATAASKSTPVLTVTRANAVALAGDTIIINDGTYSEVAAVAVGVANVTINSENDYQVTIQAASGTGNVILQYTVGTGLTLGKIIIDAQYTQSYCVQQSSTNTTNDLTFNGTYLINFKTYALYGTRAKNVTFDNNWKIESVVRAQYSVGIKLTTDTTGTVTVQNGTYDLDSYNSSVSGWVMCADFENTAVGGATLIVNNCTSTHGGSGNLTASIYGIRATGFSSYEINDNALSQTTVNSSGSAVGILIMPSAIASKKCWIYDNVVDCNSPATNTSVTGYAIGVGEDGDTGINANLINGLWIHGNDLKRANHLLFVGNETGAVVTGNKVDDGIIGVIGKRTVGGLFTGNIVKNVTTGGSLRNKAGTNDVFANNTVILTTANGIGMLSNASGATASIATKFVNNIIYMDGVEATASQVDNDSSTAVFSNNNYYSTVAFKSTAFKYQATTYATLAAWIAAQEASAINVNPQFENYSSDDYRVPASNSDLYQKGVYINAEVKDYRLRPFRNTPTVGAYEVTAGDRCATRNSRTA